MYDKSSINNSKRNYMKTLGEVFKSLFALNDIPSEIANGVITKLNISDTARSVAFWVSFDGLVERNKLFESERLISKVLKLHSAKINPKFPSELFSADYFPQLYLSIKNEVPSLNGTLNNAEVTLDNNVLTIHLLNGGKSLLDAKGFDKLLKKAVFEEFGRVIEVQYTGTFEVEAESSEYLDAIKNAEEQMHREAVA